MAISSSQPAQVNENKVRLVAFWVFIVTTISIWLPVLPVAIFIAVDFFLRSFGFGKYSPLGLLSDIVIRALKISSKPIYYAPKIFAARIGFFLSVVALVALLVQPGIVVMVTYIVFAFFAFLESFLGFCAGCYVYYFLTHIKIIKQ